MIDSFELPIRYRNIELTFNAKLLVFGFTHKFEVEVNNNIILFEPDEEKNYRAVVDPLKIEGMKKIDVELLKAIANRLEEIVEQCE